MDKNFEVFDERFNAIIAESSKLEKLYTGTIWAEGPCYFAEEGYLIWSDIPNNRMLRWSEADGSVAEFHKPSHYSNGNTRDLQGRLITCEHGKRRVNRTESNGTVVGKSLANGRLFADIEPGLSDGFRFDANSYLYTSAADSIQVFAEDGTLLGKIYVPEVISNCTFGGQDKNRLFITATTSLYAIYLNTRGVQTP
ncbi:MAG: SMP-30/gluconolactonase/LRE family protein [Anaerolineae bacterium]|nr:SMP-30/gluconolactonase/LRE family protein [Anaerolineae bacterium]